jgi:hypothetical protein
MGTILVPLFAHYPSAAALVQAAEAGGLQKSEQRVVLGAIQMLYGPVLKLVAVRAEKSVDCRDDRLRTSVEG